MRRSSGSPSRRITSTPSTRSAAPAAACAAWGRSRPHSARGAAADHPAQMPLPRARRCLALTSRAHSRVLDPYAGSGTPLRAAQGMGRRWIGIELNPTFVDLVERRWDRA